MAYPTLEQHEQQASHRFATCIAPLFQCKLQNVKKLSTTLAHQPDNSKGRTSRTSLRRLARNSITKYCAACASGRNSITTHWLEVVFECPEFPFHVSCYVYQSPEFVFPSALQRFEPHQNPRTLPSVLSFATGILRTLRTRVARTTRRTHRGLSFATHLFETSVEGAKPTHHGLERALVRDGNFEDATADTERVVVSDGEGGSEGGREGGREAAGEQNNRARAMCSRPRPVAEKKSLSWRQHGVITTVITRATIC